MQFTPDANKLQYYSTAINSSLNKKLSINDKLYDEIRTHCKKYNIQDSLNCLCWFAINLRESKKEDVDIQLMEFVKDQEKIIKFIDEINLESTNGKEIRFFLELSTAKGTSLKLNNPPLEINKIIQLLREILIIDDEDIEFVKSFSKRGRKPVSDIRNRYTWYLYSFLTKYYPKHNSYLIIYDFMKIVGYPFESKSSYKHKYDAISKVVRKFENTRVPVLSVSRNS